MVERDVHYETMYGDAMLDEMEKIAGIGSAVKQLMKRPAGAAKGLSQANVGRLAGAGVGAVGGGVLGAKGDPDDPTSGALRGALLGGVAGLGAGQLATRAGRGQAKRFAQRQLHGMTGYVPRTAAEKARGVGFMGKGLTTQQRIAKLKSMGMDVGGGVANKAGAINEAMAGQTLTKKLPTNVRKHLAKWEVGGVEARRRAAEQGLTSIPGVVKGLAKNPLQTLKTGFVAQGPTGMLLATVPTAAMLPGAVRGEGYGSEYSGKGGIGKMVGENLGYAALGAAPIAPMIAGAALAGKAGEWIHGGGQAAVNQMRAGRVRS